MSVFPKVTVTDSPTPAQMTSITTVLNSVRDGKLNNTGVLTLRANQSTTDLVFSHGLVTVDSKVFLMATTSNGAQVIGNGAIYQSAVNTTTNTITFTHVNDAATDKTFNYILIG